MLNSIKGGLRQNQGRVVFIGGYDLFQLFRRLWPDYFADEATAISRYLEEIGNESSGHSALDALTSLYDLGEAANWPKHIYVNLPVCKRVDRYDYEISLARLLLFLKFPIMAKRGETPTPKDLQSEWSNADIEIAVGGSGLCREYSTTLKSGAFYQGAAGVLG